MGKTTKDDLPYKVAVLCSCAWVLSAIVLIVVMYFWFLN